MHTVSMKVGNIDLGVNSSLAVIHCPGDIPLVVVAPKKEVEGLKPGDYVNAEYLGSGCPALFVSKKT